MWYFGLVFEELALSGWASVAGRMDGGLIGCGCSSMVERLPSKQDTRVRFPSPALLQVDEGCLQRAIGTWQVSETVQNLAAVAQLVERVLGKDEVMGSSPISSSWV